MKQTLTTPWGHLFPTDPRFAPDQPVTLVIPDRLLHPRPSPHPEAADPVPPALHQIRTQRYRESYARLAAAIDRALVDPLALVSRPHPNHPRDPYRIDLRLCRGDLVTLVSNGQSATYRSRRTPAAMSPASPPVSRQAAREEHICRAIARHAHFDPDARAFTLPEPPFGAPRSPAHAPSPTLTAMSYRLPHWPHFEFLLPENWGFARPPSATAPRKSPASPPAYRWTAAGLFDHPALPPKPFAHSLVARLRHRDVFDATPADRPANPGRGDPYKCLPRLRGARVEADYSVRPAGTSPAGLAPSDALFRLALALGRCRLFAVEVAPADDLTLTADAAAAAATVLYRAVRRAAAVARELPRQMRRAGAYGRRDVALELLELRTDAWAAYLAIDEAVSADLYEPGHDAGGPEPKSKPGTGIHGGGGGPGTSRRQTLANRVSMLNRAIEDLDANLISQIPLLRLAAGTRLLENWRRLLAPAHRDCLPWWLAGQLESDTPA